MIFDSPLQDQTSTVIIVSTYVNIIVTVVFAIEVIFKWIVYGVINNGPQSYFKDGWNLLDFIITNVSILSIIFDNLVLSGDSLAKSSNKLELVKILRVLRSIRLITRSESLKISIMSLVYAMPGIVNLAIVIFMFFLLFGIFFLNLFKGKFYSC
jgi:voltage-dependent calcium channel T type alpha-1G